MAHPIDLYSSYEVGISPTTTSIRPNNYSGWGARIRTRINGFKVRCATIAPRPNIQTDKIQAGCIVTHADIG
jgi:hypothetical protein